MADDAPDIGQNDPLAAPDSANAAITAAFQQQQQQAQQKAQAQQQPPQMGGSPLLLRYLQGMIHGGQGTVQPGQAQPSQPQSRGDMTLNFLGEFLSNMSQGLAAAGHGPGANLRGAAGAMQAPYQRNVAQYQMGQQQQAQQAQIQSEQAEAQLKQAQAGMYSQTVMTPYGPMNQQLAAKVFPAAIAAQGKVTAAQVSQGMPVDVPKELQDQFGAPAKLPLKQLNQLESAANRPLTTVQGATDAYQINRQTGQKTALGVGSGRIAAMQFRPVQVADPDHPGDTKWVTSKQAVEQGLAGPGSASVTVPRQVMTWATTGKGGEEANAFNTALQHADLLEKAFVAMQNNDQRTLQSLKNSFKTEFGSSDVTNFQTIANAYTREVSKMLSSGHMTNDEINTNGATLPANASPEQFAGTIAAYRALASSKMNMRYQQYQQGMQGKPNFPQTRTGGGGKYSAGNPFAPKQ